MIYKCSLNLACCCYLLYLSILETTTRAPCSNWEVTHGRRKCGKIYHWIKKTGVILKTKYGMTDAFLLTIKMMMIECTWKDILFFPIVKTLTKNTEEAPFPCSYVPLSHLGFKIVCLWARTFRYRRAVFKYFLAVV